MKQSILLIGAIVSLSACAIEDEQAGGSDVPFDERWEAFKQAAVMISDTPVPRYVFGGDMVAIGEDGLRREYERYFGTHAGAAGGAAGVGVASSPLTVDHVNGADVLLQKRYSDSSGGRHELTYCIQRSTFTGTELAALEPALTAAAASWSDVVNVSFRHVASQDASCGDGNTNVFFNVRNMTGNAFFGLGFFPADPRSARQLLVFDAAFTTNAGGRDLEGILRHETGHILGFRHEHVWIACTEETIDDGRLVTAYDVDSVMHYPQCRPSLSGGYRQSKRDYEGAVKLYGLATAELFTLADW
jgi:serralysin